MNLGIRNIAELIYDDFITWTIDYIEDEVPFVVALDSLEKLKKKINSYTFNLENKLFVQELKVINSILELFSGAVLEIKLKNHSIETIENILKENLIKVIEGSEKYESSKH